MTDYDKSPLFPMIWLTGQCPSKAESVVDKLDVLLSRHADDTVVLREAQLLGGLCEAASTEQQMRENERRLTYLAELFQRAGHAVIVSAGFRPSGWVTSARWILADWLFEVTLVDDGCEAEAIESPEAGFAPAPKLSLVFDRLDLDPATIACMIATKAGIALELRD
jgi:hypothetical protein